MVVDVASILPRIVIIVYVKECIIKIKIIMGSIFCCWKLITMYVCMTAFVDVIKLHSDIL